MKINVLADVKSSAFLTTRSFRSFLVNSKIFLEIYQIYSNEAKKRFSRKAVF